MNAKTLGSVVAAVSLLILGVISIDASQKKPDSTPVDLPRVVENQANEAMVSAAANDLKQVGSQSVVAPFEEISGIDVRQDRDCAIQMHYLPNGDGTTTEAIACVPNSGRDKHPYASYSNEALSSMAYADATAAEILALRLRESDEELAMSLAIRASALSNGDATVIQTYSNNYPHAYLIDGVPVEKTLHVKYVLSAVSELLGAKTNNHELWKRRVQEVSENPAETLEQLNETAGRIVASMRAIQLEVSGKSNIGVNDDV